MTHTLFPRSAARLLGAGLLTLALAACGAASPPAPAPVGAVPGPVADGTGAVTFSFSGVPGGLSGQVRVTGPGGFDRMLDVAGAAKLAPGTYTAHLPTVIVNGVTYLPEPPAQNFSVTAGGAVTTTLSYVARPGKIGTLNFSVAGLPSGETVNVHLVGPGGAVALAASNGPVLLPPGLYTATFPNVALNGQTYAASPATATVNVTEGIAVVSTVYAVRAAPVTPPASGGAVADLVPPTLTVDEAGGEPLTLTGTAFDEGGAVRVLAYFRATGRSGVHRFLGETQATPNGGWTLVVNEPAFGSTEVLVIAVDEAGNEARAVVPIEGGGDEEEEPRD